MNPADLILIIDDDAFAVKVVTSQLHKLGYKNTEGITDPLKALDFLRTHKSMVKTIVCDLQMPGLDGIELLQKIGVEGYAGRILLVSGEDPRVIRSAQRLVESMQMSLIGAMPKPIKLEALDALLAGASSPEKPAPVHAEMPREQIQSGLETSQFVNFYQPKVNVATGAVVGWEALIRWEHPVHGLLSPARFLPEMEAGGFGNELLMHVLTGPTGALNLLREQLSLGDKTFKVAVNLADSNLLDPRLPEKLLELMQEFGVSPKNLMLEVSEDRSTVDRTISNTTLSRLALKGFPLSLDDFGAGDTTMSDLSDIAITELKFDRSFVQNVDQDSAQRLSLSSCINMADTLGLNTVAEGVETLEEWNTVKSIGCRVVQGFLVGKPMPVASLARWYKDWDTRIQNGELFDRLSNATASASAPISQTPSELKSGFSSPRPSSQANTSQSSLEKDSSQKVSEES
jgi:EAL domain-containing protein (putative c-di-GMP-specific phosphodiesterase class I)/FixJ family two-component response regulator